MSSETTALIIVFVALGCVGIWRLYLSMHKGKKKDSKKSNGRKKPSPSKEVVAVEGVPIPNNETASHGGNLAMGVIASAVIAAIPTWLLYIVVHTIISVEGTISILLLNAGLIVIFGILTAFFFVEGLQDTELRHRSVPRFLGRRLASWKLLDEGKFWLFPYIQDKESVSMRTRPLEEEGKHGDEDGIEVIALAKPKKPEDSEEDDEVLRILSEIPNKVIIKVVAQIRVYVPYYYLNMDEAEKTLRGVLERTIRLSVRHFDPMEISNYQENITKYLNGEGDNVVSEERDIAATEEGKKLQEQAHKSGIMFTQLAVTDARLPDEVEAEGAKFLLERVQRGLEVYQAGTLNETGRKLKEIFPDLKDRELSNTVLVAAKLANMNVNSVHGGDGMTASATTIAQGLRDASKKGGE